MASPHPRRLVGVVSLSLGSIAVLAALQSGVATPPKRGPLVGAADAQIAISELVRCEHFSPKLPMDLPASFEFDATLGGAPAKIQLAKHSIRGDSFTVLVDRGNGVLEHSDPPAIRTYRGTLEDQPGSIVTGSLLATGFSGMITRADGANWVIQPLSDFRPDLPRHGEHVSFAATDVIPDGRGCALGRPGFPLSKYRSPLSQAIADGQGQDQGGIAGTTPSQVELACETDYEFFTKNSSSIANTINDIELIVSNVNTIYDRDVNIIFELGTIVVRSVSADPYTTGTIGGRLGELETKWASSPESGIYRDDVHMFSGYSFSGGTIGLAYLGGVCASITQGQYGVVESRYTTTLNYRISLSAHELGHNWDATHCDSQGTSACHIMCSSNGACGGISGSNLKLDPLSISEITTYLGQVACDFTRPLPVAVPFTEPFASGTLTTARWTYNDGGGVSSAATNEPSAPYSLALNSTGVNAYDDDEIRTNYILLGGSAIATASYKIERTGVETGETLVVEYFNNTLDWVALNTLTSDGTNQTVFTTYEHALPAAARHDKFRLRFRTNGDDAADTWYVDDVTVYTTTPPPPPANDECTGATTAAIGATAFDSTNATDSSPAIPSICTANSSTTISKDVWFKYVPSCVGSTTVSTCSTAAFDTRLVVYVNNASCPTGSSAIAACNDNGTECASGTSSATFTSVAGATYYMRVGGATTTAGGAGTLNISCSVACPADLNGDSVINATDLSVVLANWGGSGSGDVNASGTVDAIDLSAILAAWGNCP
ncbi:MAG: hypothetical protein EXS03_05965 [Phycisphaerales bacterium]|nr:hypothetical protein [Phycisphaerales bacterium]